MISGSPVRSGTPCAAAVATAKQSPSAIAARAFRSGTASDALIGGVGPFDTRYAGEQSEQSDRVGGVVAGDDGPSAHHNALSCFVDQRRTNELPAPSPRSAP